MSAPTPFPEPSQDPYYQPPPYQQSQPLGGGATLSGWWPRVGAQLLDWLIALGIVGIPAIILVVVLYVTLDEDTASSITSIIFYPLWFGWLFLYYPLTMKRGGNRNGQTWGMQVVGIRVVREDGYRFSGGNAIVREVLVKSFLMGLCFIVQILNYLWPLWDDKNQCLHDKICNTLVIRA